MSSPDPNRSSSKAVSESPKQRPNDGGGEWKVVVVVLSLLLVCELTIRTLGSRLSKDLVHQEEIPLIMDQVTSAEPAGILFLGNSLIRESIDIQTLETETRDEENQETSDAPRDLDSIFGKVNPDDTSIVEWRYLFEQFARRSGARDSMVVLGYAQNQLTDDSFIKPRRLGASYFDPQHRLSILSEDVTDFGGRSEVLLANVSALFASAQRIRTRVLALVIPGYEQTAQRLNGTESRVSPAQSTGSSTAPGPTYQRLETVLDLAADHQIRLVIIAIPVGEVYELDLALVDRLRTRGIKHVDGRNVEGITMDDFPDGYHMNESAAKSFSIFLSDEIDFRDRD